MQKNKNSKKAFSILELMVIIVIIAILAGAGLGMMNSYIKKSRDAARKKELNDVYNLVTQDMNQNKSATLATPYVYTQNEFNQVFQKASYKLKSRGGYCYFAGMAPPQAASSNNEFVIATWGETTSTGYPSEPGIIAVGTPQAVLNMTRVISPQAIWFKCDTPHFDTLNRAFQATDS